MKLLLDQGLPRSTVRHLAGKGVAAEHVGDLGLATATDALILDVARERRAAVEVVQDNKLRIVEIGLSTMLNSRISGNTGGEIWQERADVEEALADIRAGVDLLDVPQGDSIPDEPAISRAVTAICRVARSKLSVATKILHKKRPGLIPIFDSVVERHYWPRWCPTVKGRSWGDYAVALTRLVHKDMLSVAGELQDLRSALRENGTPLTGCRILNALMWAVLSNNEKSYRALAK